MQVRALSFPYISSTLANPRIQFDPEFQTPLIFDESLDFSDPEESRFAGAFADGLLAKSEPILSMSGFRKTPQNAPAGEGFPVYGHAMIKPQC